jgi:peptide/nickel transport system permease protein
VATINADSAIRRLWRGTSLRSRPLTRFVLRRLATGLMTLVVVSIVVFVGTSVLPGSPASAVLGRQATPSAVARIDAQLGWNVPAPERYLTWVGHALQGNLGNSAVAIAQGANSAPLWPILRGPLGNTMTLAVLTFILLVPLSLVLGTIAGLHAGRGSDNVISVSTLVLVAMPEFVVGALLIAIFFAGLGLLPPVSLAAPGVWPLLHPDILALPILTLLCTSVAWTVRIVRSGIVDVARSDYVETARLMGIKPAKVVRRYVLRNALAPSIQIFALTAQYLFGGVIVVETVFNYPGLGTQLVQSVLNHDNTEIQAIALIFAILYICINIAADLLVLVLVPKLRTQA